MMNRFFITIVFICACLKLQAQINLVKNGDFERYDTCPSTYDQVKYANYWTSIDTTWSPFDATATNDCSPDYVNTCSSSTITSAPANVHFYHYPHSGNGMMQMVMFYDDSISTVGYQRDYLQGNLYHTLTTGQSYCITYYTVMENTSGYAVNHIGAYLDDGSIDSANQCGLPQSRYTPQILDTGIIADTLNWIKIQGSFIANGTENFITVGNFFDDAHTAHIANAVYYYYGAYLIDDVSVIPSDTKADAGPDVNIAKGDTAWIGVDSNGGGMPCYWYVLGTGQTSIGAPIDSGGRIGVIPTDSTTYVVAMDLCGNVTYDTVNVWVSDLGVAGIPYNKMGGVTLYPNPVVGELTIMHAQNTDLIINDVLGNAVYKTFISADKVTVNISYLPDGIYTAQFTDMGSGERVVRKVVKR